MTVWVLILAVVTAGDGGQSVGAAWEPVAVHFTGNWEGVWHSESGDIEASMSGGVLRATGPLWDRLCGRYLLRPDVGGKVIVTWDADRRGVFRGIYKEERGRLVICFSENAGERPTEFKPGRYVYLLVLKPAARKP
jgi:hypothetical protein